MTTEQRRARRKAVLEYLRANPGRTVVQIRIAIRVSEAAVRVIIQDLHDEGLIERGRYNGSRGFGYRIVEHGAEAAQHAP